MANDRNAITQEHFTRAVEKMRQAAALPSRR